MASYVSPQAQYPLNPCEGMVLDHNAVYRVYTNSLSDYDAHLEEQREAEEAQDEAWS